MAVNPLKGKKSNRGVKLNANIASPTSPDQERISLIEPRLKTRLIVQAGIRHCENKLITAMLRRRGDADAGVLFVKVNRLDGSAALFALVTSFGGSTEWQRLSGEEWLPDSDIEKRLEKEIGFDQDIWIVEVENPHGENPFEELV